MSPEPFPWPEIMAEMMGQRGMDPKHFWALSLPELRACLASLAAPPSVSPMVHTELEALQKLYPDRED